MQQQQQQLQQLRAASAVACKLTSLSKQLDGVSLETLDALLQHGLVDLAVPIVRALEPLSPATESCLWNLVRSYVQTSRQFETASRAVQAFHLNGPGLQEFCLFLVNEGQYVLALSWTSHPAAHVDAAHVVQLMINTGNVEAALRQISERGLTQHFSPSNLVWDMITHENYSGAQRSIAKLGLDAEFPPELLMERALAAGHWDFCLGMLATHAKQLRGTFSAAIIVDRAVDKRDWVAVLKLASTQLGLPPAAPLSPALKDLVRRMVAGMVQDCKLYMAMRLVLAYELHDEFPPRALIQTMLQEGQTHHALRYVKLLGLDKDFAPAQLEDIRLARIDALRAFRALISARSRPESPPRSTLYIFARIQLGSRVVELSAHRDLVQEQDEVVLLPSKAAPASASKLPPPARRGPVQPLTSPAPKSSSRLVPTQVLF